MKNSRKHFKYSNQSNYNLVSDLVGGDDIKPEVCMDESGGQFVKVVKPRKNYPLEFKLMIAEEAKTCSVSEVARKHGIVRSCVQDWKRDELKLRAALESGQVRFRLEGGGRKPESKYL